MRNLLISALAGSGLLLGGLTATAQDRDQNRNRSDQYSYNEQRGDAHVMLFNRLRRDLDRVSENAVPNSGDQLRVDRARQEINELQNRILHGNYDARDVDHTVMAVQQVMNENHMPDWARGRLSDDLGQLRNFQ